MGNLASGEAATITIQLTPTTGGLVTHAASLTVEVLDPVSANNSASLSTEVMPEADLELIHSVLPESLSFGSSQLLTLRVTNHGPHAATSLQVVDELPAGFTFVSAVASQGACSQENGVVTCDLGTLAANTAATVGITVNLDQLGLWSNSASISFAEMDPDPDNNAASASTSVESAPVITATPQSLTVTNGNPASFGVTAFGTLPLDYQWQRNGTDLPGATDSQFVIPQTTFTDAGEYRVRVSNRVGFVFSDPATLIVRQPPTISDVPDQTVDEDTPAVVNFTVSDLETPATELQVTGTSSNPDLVPNANLAFSGSGSDRTVTVTPVPDQSGSTTITLTVRDQDDFEAVDSFVLTVAPVNDFPAISGLSDQTVAEDGQTAIAFTVADAETDANNLTVAASSANTELVAPTGLTITGSGSDRTLTIVPVADAFGAATITIAVTDGDGATANSAFLLTVKPVNDPPTLAAISDVELDENAPEQTVNLTGIGSGAGNEAQTLTVTATSSNPALIPDPAVSYTSANSTGSLQFAPQLNQNGAAVITVTVDDGGSSNNVAVRNFTVTVNNVNDLPVVAGLTNVTIDEDTATSALPFTVGDLETAAEDLVLSGRSSNPVLVPDNAIVFGGSGSNRTVTVTPLPDAFGLVTITAVATDTGGGEGTASFQLTINPINDLPAMSSIADQTTLEDAPIDIPFLLYDPETPPESIVIIATPANQTLVPVANLSFEATSRSNWVMHVQPAADQNGDSRITVSAIDSDNVVVRSTFTLTVLPVNDPPSFDPISDVLIEEDAPEQVVTISGINAGPADEDQHLTFNVLSGKPDIVPNPVLNYTALSTTAELRFTPMPNTNGLVSITVTAIDREATNNVFSRVFRVVIGNVDDPPVIVGPDDQSMDEDSSRTVAFQVNDFDTPLDQLVVTAESSNLGLISDASLVLGGTGTDRTVMLAPTANQFGASTITLTVAEATNTISTSFVVTVQPVNDSPTLQPLADVNIPEDAGPQMVTLTGVTAGPDNEADPLTVTVTSSNPALIPDPLVTYNSPASTGTLVFETAENASGTAQLTVTVDDGQNANHTVSRSFTVTVQSVNDLPVISGIGDQLIEEDTTTGVLPFVIGDVETTAENLTVVSHSSNPDLVPEANVMLGGTAGNRTVTVTPVANQSGATTITLTVTDADHGSSSLSFQLTVTSVESLPLISDVDNQTTAEDTPLLVNFTVSDEETPAEELTVSGFSSNPVLVPVANLSFGGSGENRTVTISPAANQTGRGNYYPCGHRRQRQRGQRPV